MDLKEENILRNKIQNHWYYTSKGRALRHFLGDIKSPEVLDVGAGSGVFSRQLLDEGICDSAVCLDPNYSKDRTEEHNGKRLHFVKKIEDFSQNLVLMMDVLEHVADDLALLREYSGPMKPGGHILITVPAFQFMWSGHDQFLSHYRRYTLEGIEEIVRNAGLTKVRSNYFFGTLFPAVAAIRLLKKRAFIRDSLPVKSELKFYPAWLNKLLTKIHDIERSLYFNRNRLFGLSVFCLCRKE